MKVQIKDFQIVKNASLEFVPGLNVIVGPSNNGKSSILKAIKALLYTVPGTAPIRSGTRAYTVGIDYNGHTVILQKSVKDSVYIIDGEKYTKFGTSTPEAVYNALNIKELVLNGNKEQLNFWDQMTYPFLLDRSGVELFRFIVDSGDEDQVSQALKNIVADRQAISKNITILQGSIETIDDEIETFNTIVRHIQYSSGIVFQRLFQNFFGYDIQVVGRLIENQEVRFGKHQLCQRNTTTLATAKSTDRFKDIISGK